MPCNIYTDLALQRTAAWHRYMQHAYKEYRYLLKVGKEQAETIATEANRQRNFLSQQMSEHVAACPICAHDSF